MGKRSEIALSIKIANNYVSSLTKPSLLTEDQILQSERLTYLREKFENFGKLQALLLGASNRIEQELLLLHAPFFNAFNSVTIENELTITNGVIYLKKSFTREDFIKIFTHQDFVEISKKETGTYVKVDKCYHRTTIIVWGEDKVHFEQFIDHRTARFNDWRDPITKPLNGYEFDNVLEGASEDVAALGGNELLIIVRLLNEQGPDSHCPRLFYNYA